jgi:putative CocE/NonD family hydrolase
MRLDRRDFLALGATAALAATGEARALAAGSCGTVDFIPVPLDVVPMPKNIAFDVTMTSGRTITLRAHYWYHAPSMRAGKRLPAIVDFNPYRRRDGMLYVDSMMYPWFSYNEYLCFRVDLHGSGDSEGTMSDEYTEDELRSCVQVIEQIAKLPFCDGNVGMMGKSWSAINSLVVAARDDCPSALKAVVFCCGTDDRFNDDVHYMGGAQMYDQPSWAASMWGWLPMPPDPAIVGDKWKAMWRERVRALNFWFEPWATHQTRDEYWRKISVRDRYDKVKVPVFAISGWLDGYKNPAERAVRNLGGLGKPVAAILGPWGHKYPFDGYPGPRVDWLRYIVPHWWDRYLKGKTPDESTAWPQLSLWLGDSREPDRVPDYVERGTWVAEDHDWQTRVQPHALYLGAAHSLAAQPPAARPQRYAISSDDLVGTDMLESTSWGECDNDDLPRDQRDTDRRSLYFDSAPLEADLPCFGYPEVTLELECNHNPAAIAVRLCEVSPQTGKSHLVTYRFWNLGYLNGELGDPQPVPGGRFTVKLPLNVMGHTFKRGWKVRLSISPAYVPTMWRASEISEVVLHAGGAACSLVLPGRAARSEDAHVEALLGTPVTAHVNPDQYAPIVKTIRDGANKRTARAVDVDGKPGVVVHKLMDAGSFVYGGLLDNLLVDSSATETFTTIANEPLSSTMVARYDSKLARGTWRVRAVTESKVWSERQASGQTVFRYEAAVQTYIGDEPFESHRVEGTIPRRWI